MNKRYYINDLKKLKIPILAPCIIFLKWDLWAGKTTISKHIFNNLLWIKEEIKSPTYVYYNKYWENYHFDLYRLKNYDEFFAIWWEEVFDNNKWVILVEWPEILELFYKPDLTIELKKTGVENEREIFIY
jgi:tRNA threonylcarbamoyl adenosine modification protein YjeE